MYPAMWYRDHVFLLCWQLYMQQCFKMWKKWKLSPKSVLRFEIFRFFETNRINLAGLFQIFFVFFKVFSMFFFRRVFESEINQKTQKLNISRIWPYGWGGVSSNIHILSHSWQVEEVTTPFSMWFSHRASRNAFDGWWHPYPWSTAAKTRTARDSWSKNCPVSAPGEVLQRFLFQTRSTGDIWGYIG